MLIPRRSNLEMLAIEKTPISELNRSQLCSPLAIVRHTPAFWLAIYSRFTKPDVVLLGNCVSLTRPLRTDDVPEINGENDLFPKKRI